MKITKYLFLLLLPPVCAACGSSNLVKEKTYPELYAERPLVVAVMPPINNTNNVEAKDFLYWTLAKPLCERGYYVVSPFLSWDMYKSESAYNAEQFIDAPLKQFHNVLGADAVLFTTINRWEKASLLSAIYIEITYTLKSTRTNEILFERTGKITYDGSVSGGGGGLVGALVNMAASAIKTAATAHIAVARACNDFTIADMPAGKYSPLFDKDQKEKAGAKVFTQTVR
jgi:hypothetical protein